MRRLNFMLFRSGIGTSLGMAAILAASTPLAMASTPISNARKDSNLSIIMLVLILVAIAAIALLKQRGGLARNGSQPRNLELIERMPLGPRRTLLLVRVGGRRKLIGSSENGLSDLGFLGDVETEEPILRDGES